MDESRFVDQLVEAIKTQDVKTLLHLCCDNSNRDAILKFTDDDGNRLLHLVASFGSIDLIRTLIDIGADVKEKNCDQTTVLHVASSFGNTEVVAFLLQTDDDIRNDATICEKKDYKNLFYYAAKSGNIETVKSLQNIGHFDINKIFLNGSTTLLVLVKENDSKGVETLCRCGADVNVGSISMNSIEHGYKAIHVASEQYCSWNRHNRDVKMIQILLKYNASVNEPYITPESIMQPLFMVLRRNDVRNASVLLEHGADISFQGKTPDETIGCFCLAIRSCPSLVPEFIKRGANLYETHQNCSVLMIAVDSNAGSAAIEALVKAGADIKFGRNGKTVIQCCTRYDQLKSFLNAGISVHDIESEHKVSTLGMTVATFTRSFPYYKTQSLDLKNEIAELISKGANLDMKFAKYDTPIIEATKMNLLDVFEMLIAAGANIDKPGKDGNTAVHVSCIESNWKFLEILIESGADLNKANTRGDYPLELALSQSYSDKKDNVSKEDVITKMLDKGANPNLTARCKNSPLILAIKKRLDSIVEILLHKGADISHIGEHESTAFDICLRSGHKDINIIRCLINHKLPMNQANSARQYPMELLIKYFPDITLFRLMLSNGADPNSVIAGEDSLLRMTVKLKLYDLCIALIDAGADVNKKDVDKFTAFDIFAEYFEMIIKCDHRQERRESAVALFKAFILAGIDLNQHNLFGTYPLFLAISLGMEELVTFILENDADVNIVDEAGETSLTKAISHGFDNIVQLLLRFGANVNQFCKRSTAFNQENRRGYIHTYMQAGDGLSGKNDDHPEICLLLNLITNTQFPLEKRRNYVCSLLEFGADPNLEISGNDSCLMHAIKLGDSLLVKTLLNANADIKHVGNKGCTALHVYFLTKQSSASYKTQHEQTTTGNLEENCSSIFKTLLEYGAPTNIPSSDGDLPIHIAVSKCTKQCQFDENLAEIMTMIESNKNLMNIPDKNSSTPFLAATKFCNLDVIRKMVYLGADLKSKGTYGNMVLHEVMEKKEFDKDVISFLLIHEADINAINDLEETPLITCTKRGSTYANVENITFLLENGADPNICAEGFNSAFLEAIKFDSFDVAFVLMDAKANINHIGKNGNSALHVIFSKEYFYESDESTSDDEYASSSDISGNSREGAMYENNDYSIDDEYTGEEWDPPKKNKCEVFEALIQQKDAVSRLVDAGACLNIVNNDGETPLFSLIEKQDVSFDRVLSKLLEKGADPNLGADLPIIVAAKLNQSDTIKVLLEHGVDVDQKNSRGNSALTTLLDGNIDFWRVSGRETVDIILNAGASVNLTDGEGKPPLFLFINSAKQNYGCNTFDMSGSEIVAKLIKKGADPNTTPFGEDSALIVAVENIMPTIVKILLKSGADANHIGENGQNVLHSCFRCNKMQIFRYGDFKSEKLEILEALLSKKLNVNLQDNDGYTPLQLSIRNLKIDGTKKMLSANPDMLLQRQNRLNEFDMCLMIDDRPQECLLFLDALTDHQGLGKHVDVFFHKFWEYIKAKDMSDNSAVVDSVTFKMLSTEELVNVNVEKKRDDSPLIYFCQLGCIKAVKRLLFHKANVNHVGKRGTALHNMIDLKDNENAVPIFECLLQKNAKLNILDGMGKTVLKKAIDILCGKQTIYWSMDDYHFLNGCNFTPSLSSFIQKMLQAGAIPARDDLNNTLFVCSKKSDFKGMECLIRHGGDYCAKDKNGMPLVHLSLVNSLNGALEFLHFLIDSGRPLSSIDSVKKSILLSLLKSNKGYGYDYMEGDKFKSEIVAFLIKNGACCVKDKEGNGPLHIAAKNGYLTTLNVLLQSDLGYINVFDHNVVGDTAVHICLKHPKANVYEVVRRLLESHNSKLVCNFNRESVLYLSTVICRELKTCDVDVTSLTTQLVTTLLEYGIDPNKHLQNHIPLFAALKLGNVKTSTFLLEASANVNVTNSSGKSALHIVFESNRGKENDFCLTQILLEKGINVNLVDVHGRSALFSLVEKYIRNGLSSCESNDRTFEKIFKVLLKYGAEINLSDKTGGTVLSYFCIFGTNEAQRKILLANGANPNIGFCLEDSFEGTPSNRYSVNPLYTETDHTKRNTKRSDLMHSVQQRQSGLVEELIKYGANVNYTDEMKKSALHYACDLGQLKDRYEISALLVKYGSNLNATSVTGEKPLDLVVQNMIKEIKNLELKGTKQDTCMTLTINLSLFNLLVCGGADLCPVDINSNEARINRDTNRSALLSLISNGLFQTAEYLLHCGWNINLEEWIRAFDVSKLDLENLKRYNGIYKRHGIESNKAEFKSFFENIVKSQISLAKMCRKEIRQQLLMVSNGSEIETKIATLPLPAKIKCFLSLKEFIQDNEIIQLAKTER